MKLICPECSETSAIENKPSQEHICTKCQNSFSIEGNTIDETDLENIHKAIGSADNTTSISMQNNNKPTDVPEYLGIYKIEKELAFGAVGKVYLGKHKSLHIPVAIKVLSRTISENIVTSQRFIREAKAAAQLNHINIVRILDCGVENEIIYYVMEYVKHGSTGSKLREQKVPFSEDEALAIGQSVCRALREAEKFNIVHRDIKPDNIMIAAEGLYKVADLGLAKLNNDPEQIQRSDLTGYQIGMGTPHYMAPEQAIDAKNVDQRADLYSLGVTMYQLATNKLPYPGTDVGAVLRKHAVKEIPSALDNNPNLSTEFDKMIKKCMAKTPEARYQSALELMETLTKLREPLMGNQAIHQDTVTDISGHLLNKLSEFNSCTEITNHSKVKNLWIVISLISVIILLTLYIIVN
ncbi:MAG: serine/threonine protein kinase [Lentisphaerales bacterium]|nr:serine/threonine protein kinase [Lentisphaerales bacterium]